MRHLLAALALAPLALLNLPVLAAGSLLKPQPPIIVPGGPAKFDFINYDSDLHRVLACHPGAKELVVLDTLTNDITKIDTGEVNGVAVDSSDNKYFTDGGNHDVVVIDRTTLKEVADVPVPGPADDVIYDTKNGLVYADHDDGSEVWVIDPKVDKITGTVTVAGSPEVLQYDSTTDKIYQNIKTTAQIQVIDPAANMVTATWPTDPAKNPHGLVIAEKRHWILSAGKNGKLVAVDMNTGAVVSSCDIKPGVDEVAFDPTSHLAYCGCAGFISVVHVSKKGLVHEGDVPTPGGKSVTVDPASHTVWIAYMDGNNSYLQAFTEQGTASNTAFNTEPAGN